MNNTNENKTSDIYLAHVDFETGRTQSFQEHTDNVTSYAKSICPMEEIQKLVEAAALFLGTRPPRGVVSSAAARERGRGGADGSKLAGRGCDRPPHAAGADGGTAGRVAAAGPVPLLSGGALPPRLHGVRRLLSAHLSR